jgi:hypothetical protein
MKNPWFIGTLAWFLPGSGHLLQGRWERGLLIGVVIWSMFVIGVLSGGVYFPGFDFKDGPLLIILHGFSLIGNGLGFIINYFLHSFPAKDVAAWATFEYGGKFLEVGGLLNFLAIIDSFDIAVGRKE